MSKNIEGNKPNHVEKTAHDIEYENARKSMGGRIDADEEDLEEEEVETNLDKENLNQDEDNEDDSDLDEENLNEDDDSEEDDEDTVTIENKEDKGRGNKYIPVPKYRDEKNAWKQEKDTLSKTIAEKDKEIARLAQLAEAGKTEKDAKNLDDKIQAYADKHGIEFEEAKDLVEIVIGEIKPEKSSTEVPSELKTLLEQTRINTIKEQYKEEFKAQGEPAIKELFPSATSEQIQAAADFLDVESHKPENATIPLDVLIFRNKSKLSPLLTESAPVKEKKNMPGMETGKRMNIDRNVGSLTSEDFKDGKTDFSLLSSLPEEQARKILNGFDVKTYQAYKDFDKNTNGGVMVTRAGRKILLK